MKIPCHIRRLWSAYLSQYTSEAWMRFARACRAEWLDPDEVSDILR
jgi:hypothetical protein